MFEIIFVNYLKKTQENNRNKFNNTTMHSIKVENLEIIIKRT